MAKCDQAANASGDCAAKFVIESFGKNANDPAYADRIMRSVLGSLYIGTSTFLATTAVRFTMIVSPSPRWCGHYCFNSWVVLPGYDSSPGDSREGA